MTANYAPPRFSEARHRYDVDGVIYPGVTSVLGVLNKPALLAWYGRYGTAECVRMRDEAAAHGTRVHAGAEALANGTPLDQLDPALRPWLEPLDAWLNANVNRVILAEPRVASRQHRVAGSIDLVAELLDGQTAILDLKTGSQIPETTQLQVVAYGRLLAEQEGIVATRHLAVHLPRKAPGALEVVEYPAADEPDAWRLFLCALLLHRKFGGKK